MGTIIKISVRNFLSHENFELKFGKNINFIIGKNGSGKSAILTALVVGLGGRASTTSRGSNLKSFIKYGENSAQIEIQIQNGPNKFYKQDVYGDAITVIRTINLSGGSNYKIKNDRGNIISTKYEEVSKICTAFDIQVDNPISVLNQTESQNFHASDAKVKYQFFSKGTNLDIVLFNHEQSVKNCKEARNTLVLKKEAFEVQKKELDKIKELYQDAQNLEDVRKQIKKLQNEYSWSVVIELETQVRQTKESHTKHIKRIKNYNKQLKDHEALHDQHKKSIESVKNEYEEVAEYIRKKRENYKTALSEHQEEKNKWQSHHQQLSKKKEQVHKESMKIKDLEKEISSAMNLKIDNEKETLEVKMKQLQDQLAETIARKNTSKNDLSQIQSAMLHLQNQYDKKKQDYKNLEYSKKHIGSQLNELSVRGKNNLAVFGSKMIDLVNAIQQNKHKFIEMPRGPIGSYLKVRDKKWSGALEHIIGQTLLSFCVSNNNDSRILFSLMTRIYQKDHKPTILTGKFFNKVHDVSKHAVRAPQGYFSALNALSIEDPVVANALIDTLGLESFLLVPNQDDAINFASDIKNVPFNCKKIITFDCSEFYPMPKYKSYGGRGLVSKYIQVSSSERKIQLENELKTKDIEMKKVHAEVESINESRSKFRSQESELDGRFKKFLLAVQDMERKLSEFNNRLKTLEPRHIKVLSEELKMSQLKYSSLQKEEAELAASELIMRKNLKQFEAKLNEFKSDKSSKEDQQINLKEKLSKFQLQLERNLSDKSIIQEQLDNEERRLYKLFEELKKIEEELKKLSDDTLALIPRIDTLRDKKTIQDECEKQKLVLMSLNTSGMSKNQIMNILIEKEQQCTETSSVLEDISMFLDNALRIAEEHRNHGFEIQKLIGSRMQFCFQSIFDVRHYTGGIILDHTAKTLDIVCSVKNSSSSNHANKTTSLSGGERSYATVALMLSLWDCMGLPFYFLDEFDLFMDALNRKVVMGLLVDHAKNTKRQYVFLTPLDTAYMVDCPTTKIFKLADPERAQKPKS